MKKIIKNRKSLLLLKDVLLITLFVMTVPLFLFSSQMDQNLVDDVTAMITNAKKLAHTTFLIDTSESMNTFAYSDYIDTCNDSKANISSAISLCDNAYNQCRNVEANAMCDVDLGCGDILAQCQELRSTQVLLNSFCADVAIHYSPPGKTTTIADPLGGGSNAAKKYVGPWDPKVAIYDMDICFYDWTEDTGGQVLNDQTSGHYTNPNVSGYTDRRDWDCITDGVKSIEQIHGVEKFGGLWLNWKYTTSLDAVKIIMANVHDFSYPPRSRGKRECQLTKYYPYKDDHILGRICYEEFITSPVTSDMANYIRDNWTKYNDGTIYDHTFCESSVFEVDIDTSLTILSPGDHDYGNSKLSSTAQTSVVGIPPISKPCDICLDITGAEVPCRQYVGGAPESKDTNVVGITAEVDYTCCINYECSDPKCRDDDETCRASGDPCILGYYSDFDQDQNHCCSILSCVENDPSGCLSGGRYLPGPGNDVSVEYEEPLLMTAIVAPNQYNNVSLMAKTVQLDFGAIPGNVDKVVISVYYGCNVSGEKPSVKIGEKTYTSAVVAPGDNIFAAPVDLAGCEATGYKVGGSVQLFHSGDDYSLADISVDLKFSINYTFGSDADIYVLGIDTAKNYYSEYIDEATGDPSDKVNEYECKTTFYHKQTYVQSGGSGNCNWTKITPKPSRCVEPDHTAIAKDQWGSVTKTACSWLCRDDVVYDDVWKCRGFFSQMDNPERNGPGNCTGVCPMDNLATPVDEQDNPATLEACCSCISSHAGSYKTLENPETVTFNGVNTYNCSVSGYEEGITSEGKRTYTSGYMAEIIEGHIKELGDSSYRLTNAHYVSPYTLNQWYSPLTLLNRSNSFLKESFVSIFQTGKNDRRDIACVYDLVSTFDGDDCADDCGTGCCSVNIGGGTDYCDYPNFWMKIPNTEGGQLVMPATTLSGAQITTYQDLIKSLKAKGGSTLGETLYDAWRYLGGMYSAHDPNYTLATGNQYPSPFQSAPAECFINEAIVISGGQPQFDDNSSIKLKTTQSTTCQDFNDNSSSSIPCKIPDSSDTVTSAKPYVRTNWYLSSFKNVANFVHTKDFWHENAVCRADNNVNIFGYEVGGTSGAVTCNTTTDTSGANVIDKIHTVAIGEWTLAALYDVINSDTDYLDTSILEDAATDNEGVYFGLTAKGADSSSSDVKTFYDLTAMFNAFTEAGSSLNRASGRPHWTSSLVQPLDVEEKVRGPEVYNPVTIPIDNKISRFWFGNLKKYTIDDGSSGCNMEVSMACGAWESRDIPEQDCFYPSDTGSDISDPRFALLNAGGAAKKIEDRLLAAAPSCDAVVGSNSACFTSGARNILYDDGTDILELKTANSNWFASKFQLTVPTVTQGQAIQILDYMYGYNAFGEYPAGVNTKNQIRYSNLSTVTVDDPFDIDFGGTNTTEIRPLLLGAITHSKPLAVYYEDTSTTRIFAGANDGMLHSFDQDGNETFAYIPMPVFPALTSFLSGRDGIFFNASVDGPITLLHIDQSNDGIINDGEKAYLIFGYRRGAKAYTVIDVSKLDDPKFVQHIGTEGYSFAQARVFRKCGLASCSYANDLTYYLAVPGGYDPCHDTDVPMCPKDGIGNLDPEGNEIYIYKLNGGTGAFDLVKEYKMTTPSNDPLVRDAGWLRVSLAATPVAINTRSKLTVDTEFVYFTDVSSSVFRVDVRDADPANWKFRAVFTQRSLPEPIVWSGGIRSYTATNVFPPLMKYPSYGVGNDTIPVPIVTGNVANPSISEIDEMIIYYDIWDSNYFDPPLNVTNLKNAATDMTGNGSSPWAGFDGWRIAFLNPVTEKGVTDPLVIFDMYQNNDYRISWNTYVPNQLVDCKNFGTSRNYEKILVDGQNIVDKWDPSDACGMEEISIATSVGVIATDTGYDLTFGSGHQVFTKKQIIVQPNVTNIIKWYELY